MTPHERATEMLRHFETNDFTVLHSRLVTALQSQSNEDEARHREEQAALRDLLAQQAQRADEITNHWRDAVNDRNRMFGQVEKLQLERDAALAQVERYNEMAGRDADELAELRAALDAEKARADEAEAGEVKAQVRTVEMARKLDAALAREARLREALESNGYAGECKWCGANKPEEKHQCQGVFDAGWHHIVIHAALAGGDHESA